MKRCIILILLTTLIVGCSPSAASSSAVTTEPTLTSSPIPPTVTFTPSPLPPTETLTPSPTSLPGKLVSPIDTLGRSIPWLPLDETARPSVHYVAFNALRPPFNSALVIQAFAYAVDRKVILEMAQKYKAKDPKAATTLTPPITLGRDLYDEVGIVYDPQKAKELLAQAGYSDASAFPVSTLIVNSYGDIAPGARFNMASKMAEMWKTNLGVSVKVEALNPQGFRQRLRGNTPELFWLGWAADVNDPDNFLREIFHSSSEYNYGKFTNAEFDQLVERAAKSSNPSERQELYILAERLLCEAKAALIPLYHMQ